MKAQNDSCVVFELTEAIGTVAAFNSEKFSTKIMGGASRTLRAEKHDTSVVLKVAVREATKQGYAIARGGARFRQPLATEKQNKKRTSWGRYGKYIRYQLQPGNIC